MSREIARMPQVTLEHADTLTSMNNLAWSSIIIQ
jgi:hypothetical protein